MWQRKTTGAVALALALVLFIAGIVDHLFAAPKPAVGWLLVAGVIAAVFGAVVLYRSRTAIDAVPPTAKTAPTRPPASVPPRVSPLPAGRSWWTQ